jgi:zinc resistance-associated protein
MASGVQSGLFNPEPTVAQAEQDPGAPATIQTASADAAAPLRVSASNPVAEAASPQPSTAMSAQSPVNAASRPEPATKLAAVTPHHPVNERPGYMLNDAQIASIKQRLHLTPDQEQMWPAVEAALRNIAYTHNQQARRRGAATQTAEVDPNAVQGLKSAAVPLIMSFDAEQKEEVRNLVHVMGLDQLASQF